MAKSSNSNQVAKLYQTVIEDVITNIREAFLDDGVDEQVLQELKQTWETKVVQSKAVQTQADDPRHGQGAAMPMYVYANTSGGGDALPRQVMYRTIPSGQTIQMTGAGQQAAMALPGNIVYQQQPLASTSAGQGQLYASYQPTSLQNSSQSKVVLTTHNPVSSSKANKPAQQPVTQLDGAFDSQSCSSSLSTKKGTLSLILRKKKGKKTKFIAQVDGNVGSSSEDDDEDDDEDDEDDAEEDDEDEKAEKEAAVDVEPLCSDDDGSDDDPVELFDTDNVIVCQYDKIHRTKTRWKFHLKVGIMNLDGKDFVFQRATGEAEW